MGLVTALMVKHVWQACEILMSRWSRERARDFVDVPDQRLRQQPIGPPWQRTRKEGLYRTVGSESLKRLAAEMPVCKPTQDTNPDKVPLPARDRGGATRQFLQPCAAAATLGLREVRQPLDVLKSVSGKPSLHSYA